MGYTGFKEDKMGSGKGLGGGSMASRRETITKAGEALVHVKPYWSAKGLSVSVAVVPEGSGQAILFQA